MSILHSFDKKLQTIGRIYAQVFYVLIVLITINVYTLLTTQVWFNFVGSDTFFRWKNV